MTPQSRPALVDLEPGVASYLAQLAQGGARRLREVQGVLGEDVLAQLLSSNQVCVRHGTLGPVVTLGREGHARFDRPRTPHTARSATHQVAMREAAQRALAAAYTIVDVEASHMVLRTAMGHPAVLHVSVAGGNPSTQHVRTLAHAWRKRLGLTGKFILYTLDTEPYANQLRWRGDFQVWVALQ